MWPHRGSYAHAVPSSELDRSVVGIKHKLGKTVECRKCRNARIAREKEEEDIAFTGIKEDEEEW